MWSPLAAWYVTVRSFASTSYIQTISGSGSCNVGMCVVDVRAPNSGMVEDAAQSRDGSMETKCTASVSPGSAPSM